MLVSRCAATVGKARRCAAPLRGHGSPWACLGSRAASATAEREDMARIADALRPYGSEEGRVRLEKDASGRQAWLSLVNPGKKNALSGKMMAELHDAVKELREGDEYKSTTTLFVQGTEDFFCSGADLGILMKKFTRQDGLDMSWLMQRTLHDLRALPQISVAVVNGGAMGGGTEIVLSTDFRVFQSKANFRMVQTTLGLVPGWGGGTRLVNLVGRTKALEVLCGAPKLDADGLAELGIADCVSGPDETAEAAAERFMKPFYDAKYPGAVQGAKSIIGFAHDHSDIDVSLNHEREVFSRAWQGEENKHALAEIDRARQARRAAQQQQK
ncbi:Ethylmalonyl-CoA decarboxylase [Hondaea fermentalgiana]|uniref:Ethylmalonyl-CoA decarboxylase n=1 Tax=Hondaea fermentalgiana TaxID=2315210 RepID=A0A2R5GNM0_9STRA|nr:Ethylmalonyl-CoA decarboxylase [Hondaea fermentalgiana]|eukprot:GBG31338.1 Ethylmalonyl-CoA decarboxylase [Hondaea fermentalgiana]